MLTREQNVGLGSRGEAMGNGLSDLTLGLVRAQFCIPVLWSALKFEETTVGVVGRNATPKATTLDYCLQISFVFLSFNWIAQYVLTRLIFSFLKSLWSIYLVELYYRLPKPK